MGEQAGIRQRFHAAYSSDELQTNNVSCFRFTKSFSPYGATFSQLVFTTTRFGDTNCGPLHDRVRRATGRCRLQDQRATRLLEETCASNRRRSPDASTPRDDSDPHMSSGWSPITPPTPRSRLLGSFDPTDDRRAAKVASRRVASRRRRCVRTLRRLVKQALTPCSHAAPARKWSCGAAHDVRGGALRRARPTPPRHRAASGDAMRRRTRDRANLQQS